TQNSQSIGDVERLGDLPATKFVPTRRHAPGQRWNTGAPDRMSSLLAAHWRTDRYHRAIQEKCLTTGCSSAVIDMPQMVGTKCPSLTPGGIRPPPPPTVAEAASRAGENPPRGLREQV